MPMHTARGNRPLHLQAVLGRETLEELTGDLVNRCTEVCKRVLSEARNATLPLHERLTATGDHDAALAAFKARQPMGRLGTVREVAALAH